MNHIEQYNDVVELLKNIFGMLTILGGGFWAVNKMWLSTIYQTKKDSQTSFDKLQTDMHKLERDNDVFKAQYKGDMDLLKLQNATQHEMLKDVLHKVNNLANAKNDKFEKIMQIVEMTVDEELKKRKI